jgi:hypothetical protein
MSPAERHLRSQLNQLLSSTGLLRASLSVHERTCGKPGCRCNRGQKHVSLYLVASEGGKLRQLFIPKSLEAQARQWVAAYQRVRELLEELSQLHWDKLRRREP